MNIRFINGANFEYSNAFALETDYYKGIKRPSLEIHFPIAVITYAQLEELLSDTANFQKILLTGDTQSYPVYKDEVDEHGNQVVDHFEEYTPQNLYIGYDIKGKITVDDEEITVKLYKKSDLEIENEEAMAIIDELLIAMEV